MADFALIDLDPVERNPDYAKMKMRSDRGLLVILFEQFHEYVEEFIAMPDGMYVKLDDGGSFLTLHELAANFLEIKNKQLS